MTRSAPHFTVVPYDLPRGCAAAYFPKANVLVPADSFAKENDFLRGLIGGNPWIGTNDLDTEEVFGWVSGEVTPYDNWFSGQPDNSGGNDDCVQLLAEGEWNDTLCEVENTFVCGGTP